ncbi:MAG: chromate transporter [Deltaproteobacteria bacterium]|nr:chromate transporter [Deltaproteobacteria bacterium]
MTETSAPKNIIGFLEYYLVTKAPFQLPDRWRETFVKWAPWINLIALLLLMPIILFALGVGTLALPFMGTHAPTGAFGLILLLAQTILMAAAIPGLLKRSTLGWKLAFYSQVLALFSDLIRGRIVSGLLMALIGLYILFQIRSYYK